jgi:Fe-S cluster biogenesis protein NfuA
MTQNSGQIPIQAQGTPNPRSVKFLTDRTLLPKGSVDFRDPDSARSSPLAQALFDLDGVQGIFVCQNFVTVTAGAQDDWQALAPKVAAVLRQFLSSGQPVLVGELAEHSATDGETERRIKEILDAQIRPAVAMDGGDVIFVDFRGGIVYLKMQGACGGCPSSTATLKSGIEARLRHAIPEIVAVEAV